MIINILHEEAAALREDGPAQGHTARKCGARSETHCSPGLAFPHPSYGLCIKHQHNVYGSFPIEAVTKFLKKRLGKQFTG